MSLLANLTLFHKYPVPEYRQIIPKLQPQSNGAKHRAQISFTAELNALTVRPRARAGTGSRVTGSSGHRVSDYARVGSGRVGSRVKVIFVQIRYLDPVSDRTTE